MLSMFGTDTVPVFREVHQLIKQWHPTVAEVTISHGTHMLPISNPSSVATNLLHSFLTSNHTDYISRSVFEHGTTAAQLQNLIVVGCSA